MTETEVQKGLEKKHQNKQAELARTVLVLRQRRIPS